MSKSKSKEPRDVRMIRKAMKIILTTNAGQNAPQAQGASFGAQHGQTSIRPRKRRKDAR